MLISNEVDLMFASLEGLFPWILFPIRMNLGLNLGGLLFVSFLDPYL